MKKDDDYDDDDDVKKLSRNDPSLVNCSILISNGHHTRLLINALCGNSHLRTLTLTFRATSMQPTLKKFTMEGLRSAIGQSQITKLILSYERPPPTTSDGGAAKLSNTKTASRHLLFEYASIILAVIKDSPTIIDLQMNDFIDNTNMMKVLYDNDCASKLSTLTVIQTYKPFRQNQNHFRHALTKARFLTQLTVTGMTLDMVVARMMFRQLAAHPCLRTIHLKGCGICDDAILDFCQHWIPDSRIHTLEFPENDIRFESAVTLVEAASNHQAMQCLNLNKNHHIYMYGLQKIAQLLPNLVLQELHMVGCSTAKYHLPQEIYRVHCQSVSELMLQGIKRNPRLQKLDVSQNQLFDNMALFKEFDYFVMRNWYTPLMLLMFGDGEHNSNAIHHHQQQQQPPATIWCHVFAKHSRNHNIVYYFLKQQPMLWPTINM